MRRKSVHCFSKTVWHNAGKDFFYSSRALVASYFSEK